jgi:hypothetical protein
MQKESFKKPLGALAVALVLGTAAEVPAARAEDRSSKDELRSLVESVAPDMIMSGRTQELGTKSLPVGGTGAPSQLLRIAQPDYGDGVSSLAGQSRLSPREISNIVVSQTAFVLSPKNASDVVWQWGQFVDHDVDLTEGAFPAELAPIPVPLGDPFFDPFNTGTQIIPLARSQFDPTTGTGPGNPRQQVNVLSGVIDATNVYGQEESRTLALRTLDGTGRLKTSPGNLLPFNVDGLPNAQPGGADPADFFLAGDIRSNEQVALTAMHTLWVREHNLVANITRALFPFLSGDQIFEVARQTVITEMQVITFKEFLPLLLGKNAIASYTGFDSNVNPGIANVFSTALYRLGHTMLSPQIQLLDRHGNPVAPGPLSLSDAFFTPQTLIDVGVGPFMKGLSSQVMQRIDSMIVDDVRNFLFGPPGAGGFDLASLNIQRGREHGLPDYNTFRIAYGLTPVASFADISSDPVVQSRLATAYTSVDEIDVWVGALAEDPVPGALVGELLLAGLKDQFERLRDGDPNWYRNVLPPLGAFLAETQTLAKVIARNTDLRLSDLQRNVFIVP